MEDRQLVSQAQARRDVMCCVEWCGQGNEGHVGNANKTAQVIVYTFVKKLVSCLLPSSRPEVKQFDGTDRSSYARRRLGL